MRPDDAPVKRLKHVVLALNLVSTTLLVMFDSTTYPILFSSSVLLQQVPFKND